MDDSNIIACVSILLGAWLVAGFGAALILAAAFFGIKEKNLEENEDDS